jgi:predicted AAA+ superfamily ATPase
MELMPHIDRLLRESLLHQLERGKSVLLLGPRQVGKTTLLSQLDADLHVSLVDPGERQRFERDPGQLAGEVEALAPSAAGPPPLVVLDEVQKVPAVLDVVQSLIDAHRARFVLCGSSARKLRRGGANLLAGRVVTLRLDPLALEELAQEGAEPKLDELLLFGSLPGIWTVPRLEDRERDLGSYVETYLEEEVRAEALVRSLGSFGRFLELAAIESGNLVSMRAISQEVGVSHTTIASYYEILEDCLIAERIDPLTRSRSRKKLTRSSRWLFFDLGVRRLAAREGTRPTPERLGQLFEQLVGLELLRCSRRGAPSERVLFWRDPDGPEVDWVYATGDAWIPVEVKWTDRPTARDARHVGVFLDEYEEAPEGFVVCRTPRRVKLAERVTAIPWREVASIAGKGR